MMYFLRLVLCKFERTILAMKKLVWVLVGVLTFIFTPVTPVRAEATQRGLLLAEVQTGSATSASEEFIELYNNGPDTLDLSKYFVQYFSASSVNFDTPSRNIALSGTLYPQGRYLLASTGYLTTTANISFSATLAKTGGHLRLVSNESGQTIIHDLLGWGTASMPETNAAHVPNGGESLQRKVKQDDTYQDTDNNNQDFVINTAPTPESANPIPTITQDPAAEPPISDPEPPVDEPVAIPSLPIQITELLPNPAYPQTDASDEYIELFNPNVEPIDLTGYRIEAGDTYSYNQTLDGSEIPARGYIVLYSRNTSITLSNTSGKVRLIDPNGEVVFETAAYDSADDGMAWTYINGTWQWTTTPTPGAPNIVTSVPITNVIPKVSAPKKTATPKKSNAKVASAKTVKPKANTTKSKKITDKSNQDGNQQPAKSYLHPAILAGVGLLAVGYGAYEYRESFANQLHKLRSKRANRRETGQPS